MSNKHSQLHDLHVTAKAAAAHAHAPYSRFKVGAAFVTDAGELITGCNVENVSYGLSNCAERTAIFTAVAQGADLSKVKQLVIYTPSAQVYSPCGACRQVMAEFFQPETEVISTCDTGQQSWTVATLLPDAFHFDIEKYRV
ncbi:cytidine deaminase [Pseudidiomarina gelatinasegens]|uniref:Cytidine deaminase n=1 Tax=Pseudidiomarina gelatinasegens TaxID=2487740 RepID=A0A443YXJ5_9GAMM|nr:cytidine deaminase [Pseudidiomarina gelatinasegens]RWU08729.1 cytidine deaminase [Pseudidiomarina gelatinasegens]